MSIETELPTLDLDPQLVLFEEDDPILVRCAQLMELEESKKKAIQTTEFQKMKIKKSFDRKA